MEKPKNPEIIDHSAEDAAAEIHVVYQLSYQKEADLIGIKDFPPLRRTAEQIQSARSQFLGQRIDSELAAMIEFHSNGVQLSIDKVQLVNRIMT